MSAKDIKITYLNESRIPLRKTSSTIIEYILVRDNWDDFGYKTSFSAYLCINTKIIYIGTIKILVEGEQESYEAFNKLGNNLAINGKFNLSGKRYISLTSFESYQILKEEISNSKLFLSLLRQINDVLYLEIRSPKSKHLNLRLETGFGVSLLRDEDFKKAYGQASRIIFPRRMPPKQFNFNLEFKLTNPESSNHHAFNFEPDKVLPTNIWLLIGKNGTGKTSILNSIIKWYFEKENNPKDDPFKQLIVIRYTLSESSDSPLTLGTDTKPFAYCGLQTSKETLTSGKLSEMITNNIIDILRQDSTNHKARNNIERPKVSFLIQTIKDIFRDPHLRICLKRRTYRPPGNLSFGLFNFNNDQFLDLEKSLDWDLALDCNFVTAWQSQEYLPEILFFSKDNLQLTPSTGQEMFLLILSSTIKNVKKHSLILIDEPESYLHPDLEVLYMKLLRNILQIYESYSIIATHSLFIAREVPAKNITIMRTTEERICLMSRPTIETFGSDLTAIANEVFDNIIEKPFETTLKALLGPDPERSWSEEKIILNFKDKLNLESLTLLRNTWLEQVKKSKEI